ncbi:Trp biosynthesis-associated membrane protein [Naasia sp. SYSU D00057]|uniref:Trp biosynthesis-associated membrane protein n=1 Tax=Naasia sp. SYSU D00057 TaxID=2817380 RepID=UPI001B3048EF|nr:Trp biosynthesis-associated membrane protein [Naasia sp. SYSU D00057]
MAAAVLLAAANTPWFTVTLRPGGDPIEVGGAAAAPALNGIALAVVACVGALSLAPKVLRWITAAVLALLGIGAGYAASAALADPLGAAERSVSAVSGVAGRESVEALVAAITPTAWPAIAVAGGAMVLLFALGIAVTAGRWPGAARSYGTGTGTAAAAVPAAAAPSDTWDALSRGADPTSAPPPPAHPESAPDASDGPGSRPPLE